MLIAETKNIVVREFSAADAPFILELLNTPAWLQFIGDRNVHSIADAEKYLNNGPIKSYSVNGFGLYLVQLKDTKVSIGMCGLIKRDFLHNADIGFAFLPQYAAKGYGYESAMAVLKFAKQKLALPKVIAITSPENTASINLLKKLNMQFEKMIRFPDEDKECMQFGTAVL